MEIEHAKPQATECANRRRFKDRMSRKRTRRPFEVRPRVEGGRWPGPHVVRDGERCYRWPRAGYSPAVTISTATGGLEVREAARRYCALYFGTADGVDWFNSVQRIFPVGVWLKMEA
jgi:hypothetical protein